MPIDIFLKMPSPGGEQQGGGQPLLDVVGQIVHGGVVTLGYPLAVLLGCRCINGMCLGQTAGKKTETQGLGFQLFTRTL